MGPTQVVDGIAFPEGLVWSAATQTLRCCGTHDGTVYEIDPEMGTKSVLGVPGGGANNLVPCDDGGLVVLQNGGIDGSAPFNAAFPGLNLPRPGRVQPGLQRLGPDGSVTYLVSEGCNAPNDGAVGPDGALYFTDPGNPLMDEPPPPRLMRLDADGGVEVFAPAEGYCNGITVDTTGRLLVSEGTAIVAFAPDGGRTVVHDGIGVPGGDGLCTDEDGNIYVAAIGEGCVTVIGSDGVARDRLVLDAPSAPTNCCFGGRDLRQLFVTDSATGRVLVFDGMPVRGIVPTAWSGLVG